MKDLLKPLTFARGPSMRNRFMLAPLTNTQSHKDGVLSEDEFKWLTMRAEGGFGLTMTCAAHVQAQGKGFPGQLGVFSEKHLDGLTRLASKIKLNGSVAICQLHHAGMRSPKELIAQSPVCPSVNKKFSARAMSLKEIETLRDDFIKAAVLSENSGFDGVELHAAHGYILAQFLSPDINQRTDAYGQSLDNRCRLLNEIIEGIRNECNKNFMIGVRLSPERFDMRLSEIVTTAQNLMTSGMIDFLDMSLWDVFKEPEEENFKGKTLLSYFTELKRGSTRLGAAGSIRSPEDAERALSQGLDWVMLGRAGMLHHNFPNLYQNNPNFLPVDIPVSTDYLLKEGLSDVFIEYISKWGFTSELKSSS